MTINGRRKFRSNAGKRYMVTDLYKQDTEAGKYRYYMMVAGGPGKNYKICYGSMLNMLKFRTIKEAQRYVRDWECVIQTCDF